MAGLSVADRLAALGEAVEAGRGVLDPGLLAAARELEERAGHRMRLSEQHTVVALAGATGSGKSSLVNALVGAPVAAVDVLRPTTSRALAAVRGSVGSGPLLDWLGVPERVVVGEAAEGLVLLDLPDHDSVQATHRVEAERLLALVDLMVWVLDPQKYADGVLHERYLRPLARHADVMLVVLNQVDRLDDADRAATVGDLRRLLADDGLAGVPVLSTSALDGTGVPALRAALDEAARRRVAARARIEADVVELAHRVVAACVSDDGHGGAGRRSAGGGRAAGAEAARAALVDAFAEAAGVPTVVEAVRGSTVLAAHRATGWPPTRWLARLRADPLHTLHLGGQVPAGRGGVVDPSLDVALARTSLPRAGAAALARAGTAVRGYVDTLATGLPDAWVLAAREAAMTDDGDLAGELDLAVATAPLSVRRPAWWSVVGALQWLLLAVAVVGAGWLAGLAGLDALGMPSPEPPRAGQVPVPTLAAIGGALAGLVTAGLARLLARWGAARQARRATAAMRAAVADIARRLVTDPVDEVLARREACRSAAGRAAEERRRSR